MRADKSCPCCAHFNMYSYECASRRSITSNDSCCDFKLREQKEVKMESKKYYVFNPKAGKTPSKVHTEISTATSEAERIAEIEPNTEILVVQVVVGITHPSKQFIYRNYKLQ